MMKRRVSRIGIAGAALAGALALAACGPQPYPTPEPEAPPPPRPAADLAGGPTTMTPLPPPAADSAQGSAPPVIIAMAPIPNPPERPRAGRHRTHHRYAAASSSYHYVAPAAPAPHAVSHPAVRPAPALVKPAVKAPAPKLAVPAKPIAPAKPKLATPKPAPKLTPATPVVKAPAPAAGANSTSPLGDRATRLAALESSLAEALQKSAVLKAPSSFTDKPADVTLTIPADFAQTVKDEATKNDLGDAAASVNLTSILSGDGYTATPDTTQSQPLVAAQPTEFHWSVTAAQGAKGPLHADVGADLLGAGSDILNLGSVQASDGLGLLKSNRALGVGILVLLAVLVLAWLARGRGGPSRSSAARREARRARRDTRPVILSDNEPG